MLTIINIFTHTHINQESEHAHNNTILNDHIDILTYLTFTLQLKI